MALLFASVILTVFAAEKALRVIHYPQHFCPNVEEAYETIFDPDLGWKYAPSQTYEKQGITYTITAEGYRAATQSESIDRSKKLIFVVGDSYLFGHRLPFEDTFGAKLQKKLGTQYQVINFSAQSYGSDQLYLLMHRLLQTYQPVAIITDYIIDHDIRNLVHNRQEIVPCLRFPGTKPQFAFVDGVLTQIAWPEPYAEFDRWKVREMAEHFLQGNLKERAEFEGHELSKALVKKMKEEADAKGIHFSVISFDYDSFEFNSQFAQGKVLGLSTGSQDNPDQYHIAPTDPHPNSLGTTEIVKAYVNVFGEFFR